MLVQSHAGRAVPPTMIAVQELVKKYGALFEYMHYLKDGWFGDKSV